MEKLHGVNLRERRLRVRLAGYQGQSEAPLRYASQVESRKQLLSYVPGCPDAALGQGEAPGAHGVAG